MKKLSTLERNARAASRLQQQAGALVAELETKGYVVESRIHDAINKRLNRWTVTSVTALKSILNTRSILRAAHRYITLVAPIRRHGQTVTRGRKLYSAYEARYMSPEKIHARIISRTIQEARKARKTGKYVALKDTFRLDAVLDTIEKHTGMDLRGGGKTGEFDKYITNQRTIYKALQETKKTAVPEYYEALKEAVILTAERPSFSDEQRAADKAKFQYERMQQHQTQRFFNYNGWLLFLDYVKISRDWQALRASDYVDSEEVVESFARSANVYGIDPNDIGTSALDAAIAAHGMDSDDLTAFILSKLPGDEMDDLVKGNGSYELRTRYWSYKYGRPFDPNTDA